MHFETFLRASIKFQKVSFDIKPLQSVFVSMLSDLYSIDEALIPKDPFYLNQICIDLLRSGELLDTLLFPLKYLNAYYTLTMSQQPCFYGFKSYISVPISVSLPTVTAPVLVPPIPESAGSVSKYSLPRFVERTYGGELHERAGSSKSLATNLGGPIDTRISLFLSHSGFFSSYSFSCTEFNYNILRKFNKSQTIQSTKDHSHDHKSGLQFQESEELSSPSDEISDFEEGKTEDHIAKQSIIPSSDFSVASLVAAWQSYTVDNHFDTCCHLIDYSAELFSPFCKSRDSSSSASNGSIGCSDDSQEYTVSAESGLVSGLVSSPTVPKIDTDQDSSKEEQQQSSVIGEEIYSDMRNDGVKMIGVALSHMTQCAATTHNCQARAEGEEERKERDIFIGQSDYLTAKKSIDTFDKKIDACCDKLSLLLDDILSL
ncbi:hypothetical protein ADUPG1_012440 [Aduncisulcus paluster]|uniref:Uncharacterized protein n=1 Tax=Aduncisulcus paluster TaxID=2918883 RepID=A0ABQ5JZG4_9EUKA|nr:hypothetical protein ADUPG1_012440 [Aduncisulcus paluster]